MMFQIPQTSVVFVAMVISLTMVLSIGGDELIDSHTDKDTFSVSEILTELVDEVKAEREELTKEIAGLESQVSLLSSSNFELESQVSQLSSSNFELESQVNQLSSSNSELESQVNQLSSSNSELESQVNQLSTSVASKFCAYNMFHGYSWVFRYVKESTLNSLWYI